MGKMEATSCCPKDEGKRNEWSLSSSLQQPLSLLSAALTLGDMSEVGVLSRFYFLQFVNNCFPQTQFFPLQPFEAHALQKENPTGSSFFAL